MPDNSSINRRDFLNRSIKTATGFVAFSGVTFLTRPGRVFGAADRIRVAVCGLHGRGKDHLSGFSKLPNVDIAGICDVDENVLRQQLAGSDSRGLPKPRDFTDVRKLLEDKSIDAISIASQNHWHTLMTVWACQAGKDVYVEKPCSHNIFETRQIVAEARKYNRMVQQGSQIRSSVAVQEAVEKMRGGLIGDVYMARGLCFKWRDTIGRAP